MKTLLSRNAHKITFGLLLGSVPPLTGQEIELTGGGADITFFYDSGNNAFATVFRTKGNTEASGLTEPFGEPAGGVGGSASDYVFSELIVRINGAPSFRVGSGDYFVSSASGGFFQDPAVPDLGVRTRLREGDPAIQQFESLRWILDLENSQLPENADIVIFGPDALSEDPRILLSSAAGDLSHDWPNWGHSHWHWGFSKHGEYHLAFDIEGIGGEYAQAGATGSFAVSFVVNPAMWFGYEIGEDFIVQSSFGLFYVEHRPWVYSYDLRKYVFMPEQAHDDSGAWLFLLQQ